VKARRRRGDVARRKRSRREAGAALFDETDASLLDVLDHVLNKGATVTGDVVLGIGGIDLIYVRLSALLCAVDRLQSQPRDGRR
jgi:hypothetical protein